MILFLHTWIRKKQTILKLGISTHGGCSEILKALLRVLCLARSALAANDDSLTLVEVTHIAKGCVCNAVYVVTARQVLVL